ncbi:MAG: Rieske 2Fe-2S domain-containing protein [Pseudomonadota bacterium]
MDTETQSPPEADTMPAGDWYVIAKASAVKPGQQIRRVFKGKPVLIGRTQAGELFAMRDICPHRLVPLSAGKQIDTGGEVTVECPYHGWRFGTDGVCRLIPSLMAEDPYTASDFTVAGYGIAERGATVFLCDSPERGLPDALSENVPGSPKLHLEESIASAAGVQSNPSTHPLVSCLGWRLEDDGETCVPWAFAAKRLSKKPAKLSVAPNAPGVWRERLTVEGRYLETMVSLTPVHENRVVGHVLMWWQAPAAFSLGAWDARAGVRSYFQSLRAK